MKFLVSFVLLVAVSATFAGELKDMAKMMEKCNKDSGYSGDIKSIKPEGATKEQKCLLKCIMEEKEVIKPDGDWDKDMAMAYIDASKMPAEEKEKFKKALGECMSEIKLDRGDLCETAYKVFQCRQGKMKA